jgi:hypothetical protein
MRNEKYLPMPGQGRWRIRSYWQSSLLLLLFPTFHGDWATNFSPKNDEPALASFALPNAHAHNDYLHEKPLLEALLSGFTSIEADVHLVGGELYLGHWMPWIFPAKTLREFYLEPLNKILSRQNGKVYPNFEGVFYLMIDVKTDSLATYLALRQLLLQYPIFQCNPHFQVFISGNRAMHYIQRDEEQVAAVDGRLPDLSKQLNSDVMPVVSDNFRKYFKWRGKSPMSARETERLQAYVNDAHRQGKKLRFWNIPDQPNAWETLLKARVDFISTDDLQGMQHFLLSRKEASSQVIPEIDYNHFPVR